MSVAQSAGISAHPRPGGSGPTFGSQLVWAAVAVVVGLAGGALTEWSVLHLPYDLLPLSNTAAPWVLLTFLVALAGRRTHESVLLGVCTLVALVVGFYVAQELRGWAVSRHEVAFWSVSGVIVGPLIGAAAAAVRHRAGVLRAVGAGIVGGLLVGEAMHGLISLRYSTTPVYWDVQIVVGIVLAGIIGLIGVRGVFARLRAYVGAGTALVVLSAVTLVVYQGA